MILQVIEIYSTISTTVRCIITNLCNEERPSKPNILILFGGHMSLEFDKICLPLVIAYLIMRDNTLSTVYMNDRFLCIITVPTLYTLEFIWTFICLHCWKYICKNKSIIICLCIYISISIYFSLIRWTYSF